MAIENEEIFYHKNEGVMIIDPNKVMVHDLTNNTRLVKDRYIKQEDLVMYAGLKAYSKGKSDVFGGNQEGRIHNFGEIAINFLNPLQDEKTHKNFFTTQWTDAFTDKSIKENMIDPETFGIKSIEVTENASMVPTIKIEFIDVRGKTLLEKGDDDNNPYNLFYSLPYPTFMLTIKGYYGKALTYPLILLKTNTTFDPGSGDYLIRCEFLSRTFAIFNDFLLVYGVAAPYMFPLKVPKDGFGFEGMYILKELYRKQNEEILAEELVRIKLKNPKDETTIDQLKEVKNIKRRLIEKPVTIYDLLKSAKDIHMDDLTNFEDPIQKEYAEARSLIDTFSNQLGAAVKNLLDYYKLTAGSVIFLKKDNTFVERLNGVVVNDKFSVEIHADIININDSFTMLSTSTNKHVKKMFDKINLNKTTTTLMLGPSLFITGKAPNDESFTDVKKVKELFEKIETEIQTIYSEIGNVVVDYQRDAIKIKIGFDITVENIIRIFMNSMQVFLMLMNLTTKKSFIQIKKQEERRKQQKKYGEYVNDDIMYPWPNYYIPDLDVQKNAQPVNKRSYPGFKLGNRDWPEVIFIEELYKAFDVLKDISAPPTEVKIELKETTLISPFLNVVSLDQYAKYDELSLCTEILNKINLSLMHDGILFKELPISNIVTAVTGLEAFDFVSLQKKMSSMEPSKAFFPLNKMSKIILEGDANLYENLVKKIQSSVADPIKLSQMINTENNLFVNNKPDEFKAKTLEIKNKNFFTDPTDIVAKIYNNLVADDNVDPLKYATPGGNITNESRTSAFDHRLTKNNEYIVTAKLTLADADGKHPYDIPYEKDKISLLYGFEYGGILASKEFKYDKVSANLIAKVDGITTLTVNNVTDDVPLTEFALKYNIINRI